MMAEEPGDVTKPKYRKILPKLECDQNKQSFIIPTTKLKRVYKCSECPEAFNSFRLLKTHERLIHDQSTSSTDTVSICKYCCCLFADAETLDKHEKELHNGDKPYSCPPCKIDYKSKGFLLKHVCRTHHSSTLLYYCTLCCRVNADASVFYSKLEIEKHYSEMHLVIPSEQRINDEDDNVGIDMQEEFLEEFLFCNTSENSFQSPECWESLDLHLTDVLHLLTEPNQNTEDSINAAFKCPKCCHNCVNQKELCLHLAYKHSLKVLVCSTCEASFNRVSQLTQHRATHTAKSMKNKTLQQICELCDKSFKNPASLNYHMKSHTRSSNPPQHDCPYCGKSFHTDRNMKQHLRTVHSQVKRHICQLCDKLFASLDHLKKHVLSQHQNERKHICHICAKAFTQLCHLKQHIGIHTTGKTLQCNVCEAKFWKKIDLERHTVEKHVQ